jgi:hypothetical protein
MSDNRRSDNRDSYLKSHKYCRQLEFTIILNCHDNFSQQISIIFITNGVKAAIRTKAFSLFLAGGARCPWHVKHLSRLRDIRNTCRSRLVGSWPYIPFLL